MTVGRADQLHLSQVVKVPMNNSFGSCVPWIWGMRTLLLGGLPLKPITPV